MITLWLTLTSGCAWFLSSLAGGGSALILIPAISFLLGTAAIPPTITTGMIFGNGQRVWLYWPSVNWSLTAWYLPGAISGAVLGAFVFSRTQIEWLSLLLALFLISSALGYLLGQSVPFLQPRAWYFLPLGGFYAFASGLIGSTGPMLQPFYLGYGLVKDELLATKSLHVLVVHAVKLAAYAAFGVLPLPYLGYGVAIGCAALPGNWLGQQALQYVSEHRFRQLVIVFIALSGGLMLWQQRQFWAFW
ncbi:MAG: sulfite exporter TauE/SafE family protein [Spirulinaceae cyanobacterium RM2_2_10]|nr:sulfite exporter TauE/SafE family protein [Spirulinaceae cyanobacterium SM2_1_0]NJO19754.1 sulfite exporter TauE/SafE family protein [Spirulinaceae cyanobacterium RM2_2_10]